MVLLLWKCNTFHGIITMVFFFVDISTRSSRSTIPTVTCTDVLENEVSINNSKHIDEINSNTIKLHPFGSNSEKYTHNINSRSSTKRWANKVIDGQTNNNYILNDQDDLPVHIELSTANHRRQNDELFNEIKLSAIINGKELLMPYSNNGDSILNETIISFGGEPFKFGSHVSYSKDENTIAIGSPHTCICTTFGDSESGKSEDYGRHCIEGNSKNNGFVQVFRRQIPKHNTSRFTHNPDSLNSSWKPMGQLLLGEFHDRNDNFGSTISLSSDGDTIGIGSSTGYVKIYRYHNDVGSWEQIGRTLSQNDRFHIHKATNMLEFGKRISMSNSGDLSSQLCT